MKCPKSLFVLWQEYEFGLGGRIPANHFVDLKDRGRVNYKYCIRKNFWDLITKMIQHGYSHTPVQLTRCTQSTLVVLLAFQEILGKTSKEEIILN